MKAAMRASLKECLGTVKSSLRGKRMASSYGRKDGDDESSGDSDGAETRSGSVESDSRGTPGTTKALTRKVVEAEDSGHEEMAESGNWREEEMKEFMKKRVRPKVKREGSLAAIHKAAKKG